MKKIRKCEQGPAIARGERRHFSSHVYKSFLFSVRLRMDEQDEAKDMLLSYGRDEKDSDNDDHDHPIDPNSYDAWKKWSIATAKRNAFGIGVAIVSIVIIMVVTIIIVTVANENHRDFEHTKTAAMKVCRAHHQTAFLDEDDVTAYCERQLRL
jgi:hypothetical protein